MRIQGRLSIMLAMRQILVHFRMIHSNNSMPHMYSSISIIKAN